MGDSTAILNFKLENLQLSLLNILISAVLLIKNWVVWTTSHLLQVEIEFSVFRLEKLVIT